MPILEDIFEKPIIADGVIGDILKPKPKDNGKDV